MIPIIDMHCITLGVGKMKLLMTENIKIRELILLKLVWELREFYKVKV